MIQIFKQKLLANWARKGFLSITAIAFLYHALVISGIVDYKYAWGGRLESVEQMYQFETVSVILSLLFVGVVIANWKLATNKYAKTITKGLLLVISLIFLLNTVGNIFAVHPFEAILFTPLTLLSAIFAFRLGIES